MVSLSANGEYERHVEHTPHGPASLYGPNGEYKGSISNEGIGQ